MNKNYSIPVKTDLNRLNELHDWAYKTKIRLSKRNKPIYYEDKILDFIDKWNFHLKTMKIHLAKDTYELSEWGEEMHHCIGGYADAAVNGNYLFMAVKKENELLYNIMLKTNDFSIVQFRGKYNIDPMAIHSKEIMDAKFRAQKFVSICDL